MFLSQWLLQTFLWFKILPNKAFGRREVMWLLIRKVSKKWMTFMSFIKIVSWAELSHTPTLWLMCKIHSLPETNKMFFVFQICVWVCVLVCVCVCVCLCVCVWVSLFVWVFLSFSVSAYVLVLFMSLFFSILRYSKTQTYYRVWSQLLWVKESLANFGPSPCKERKGVRGSLNCGNQWFLLLFSVKVVAFSY